MPKRSSSNPSKDGDARENSLGPAPRHAAGVLSRRDLLKLTVAGGAAMGAVALLPNAVAAAASPVAAPPPQAPAKGRTAPVNQAWTFAVDIPGAPQASKNIRDCQIDQTTIDVRETTTGADWDYRLYAPGATHWGNATFRCAISENSDGELLRWFQEASSGKEARKQISVSIKDRAGAEARRFNLVDCFPTRWDAGDYSPSSNTVSETIKVKIGRIEFKV